MAGANTCEHREASSGTPPHVRWFFIVLLLAGCRIERASPGGVEPGPRAQHGELWIYTSMYRHVVDALEPKLQAALPGVTLRWFQAGSEKVTARLEAEFAAGGTPCDVLLTSDPFLYERFKEEQRWLRYVSPDSLRVPRRYVDLDGHYAAVRLSTMVLVHRDGAPAPASFAELAEPKWRGEVVLGDPLTSGTAFSWALSMQHTLGADYFARLRANDARVVGGNAAVLQKLEGSEAKAGVLLLENALAARVKGSPIGIDWPADGAVVVPGDVGIFASSKNPEAAKAFVDALYSREVQELIANVGGMHAVDPRVSAPGDALSLDELLQRSAPWDDEVLQLGVRNGANVKADFAKAFAK